MTDIRVAIFQPDARDDTPGARLERVEARLDEAGAGAYDLMLCPELYLSGYDVGPRVRQCAEPADGPSLRHVAYLAEKYDTALAIGYPELAGQTLYNAIAVIGKSGERLLDYRKRLLPPGFEDETFTPGKDIGIFDFMGQRVAVLICYDVEFPEIVRQVAMAGAGIVLAPTALRSKWRFVARKMIPTRAFENGLFLLYANYAGREGSSEYLGQSVIVAPDGCELALAGMTEEVISARLDMLEVARVRETLPYLDVVGTGGLAA